MDGGLEFRRVLFRSSIWRSSPGLTSWGSYRIGERIAGQIVAFVTAHIDDSTYRLLCRRALRDDGVIAYHRADLDTRVEVFRNERELDHCGSITSRLIMQNGRATRFSTN